METLVLRDPGWEWLTESLVGYYLENNPPASHSSPTADHLCATLPPPPAPSIVPVGLYR